MSIQGPGILFRLRAGGNAPGLANVNSVNGTYIQRNGILATALANKLRTHWSDNNGDGVYETPTYVIEPAATNIMLWSRDCSNAAWTKSSTTAVKTQTGVDGASNSASLITATAGNGTCLQGVTSASSIRSFTAFVKRSVGTGVVNMTMDGGSTWTAITLTTQFTRFRIPTQTVTNPSVGFRLVTNGDAIVVDYCQLESTSYDTTPILTTSATATRNTDAVSATFNYRPVAMTLYAKYVSTGIAAASDLVVLQIGSSSTAPRCYLAIASGAAAKMLHAPSASTVSATTGFAPTAGQVVELRGVLNSDGSVFVGQSIAGAAETVSSTSGALAFGADWSGHTILIGSIGSGSNACPIALQNALILSGVRSLQACQGLV